VRPHRHGGGGKNFPSAGAGRNFFRVHAAQFLVARRLRIFSGGNFFRQKTLVK
jgi:hypothetical protein